MGCKTDGTEIASDATTGLNDPSLEIDKQWTFYPNPATHNVTVLFEGLDVKEKDLMLFDMMGKKLNVPVTLSQGMATIDVSTLQPGGYVIRLNNTIESTRLLIVQ